MAPKKYVTYMPVLDSLRAFAVLTVVLVHTMVQKAPGGGIGVDIFFAISGFLIIGLLLQEYESRGRISIAKFYGRRALRLFPALWLMLLVAPYFLHPDPIIIVGALFYFMNYLRILGYEDGFLGHTWSLSVEEQFYLVWPFLFLLICVLSRTFRVPRVRLLVVVLAVLAVLSISWRTYLTLSGYQYTAYNDTFARAAGFFIGGLATFTLPFYRRWVSRGFSHVLGVVGFSAVALYLFTGKIMSPIADLWLVPVLSALLVLWSARIDDPLSLRIFSWAPVNYIGKISYGMYLWHFPLIVMLPEMLPKYRFVAVTIASILIAALSYHLMEKPLSQKLRTYVTV